jgi:hypothetical protein
VILEIVWHGVFELQGDCLSFSSQVLEVDGPAHGCGGIYVRELTGMALEKEEELHLRMKLFRSRHSNANSLVQ